MARLNYEKARRRRPSGSTRRTSEANPLRQQALQQFVTAKNLACFKCKTRTAEWAKTGITTAGRAWAICTTCLTPKSP